MISQHLESIELYDILHNYQVKCNPDLGMDYFYKLTGASPGAGGALLLNSQVEGYPVVIKVFPTDCNFKYLKDRAIPNKQIRDYGDFEPGTGLLLTHLF